MPSLDIFSRTASLINSAFVRCQFDIMILSNASSRGLGTCRFHTAMSCFLAILSHPFCYNSDSKCFIRLFD